MPKTSTLLDIEGADREFRSRALFGLVLVFLLIVAGGGWAATSRLSGAVIAGGQVVVDGSVRKVQHPTGGVVGKIHVKNGDVVEAGDIVLSLDETQARANLGIVQSQIDELTGRKARLAAERDSAAAIEFPAGFEASSPEAKKIAEGEVRLFQAKRHTSDGKRAQLKERVGQFRHEIEGLTKQEKSKSTELELIKEELGRLEGLYEQKLVPVTRVLATRRDGTRIDGEHGSIISQIARLEGQIDEAQLQIIEIEETTILDAQKELRDVEARLAELAERRVAAEDQLKRIHLRAPSTGMVHELAAHTEGGVIGPGDVVMSIVPNNDTRTIEVRISPADIDQLHIGQKVMLRFSAFNQRTTPEINGVLARLAADVTREPQTGATYYTARVGVSNEEIARLGDVELVAGMPVEAFVQTGDRTVFSFLTKPLADQFARAFKEQ